MARLVPRYSEAELDLAVVPLSGGAALAVHPPTGKVSPLLDPKVVCIEHFMPKDKPILPGASHRGQKPAAKCGTEALRPVPLIELGRRGVGRGRAEDWRRAAEAKSSSV